MVFFLSLAYLKVATLQDELAKCKFDLVSRKCVRYYPQR